MDSNGVSRDGPPTRQGGEDLQIEPVGAQSPLNTSQNSHQRGVSESQNLLPDSQRNSFEYEVTKAFRYVAAPVLRESLERQHARTDGPVENGVPQTLKRNRKELWRGLVVDLFMICVALPLFALAAAVIHFDGREATEYTASIFDNCTKVAATLFPFVFSMVVGRTTIKLASWKLERGVKLGLLERLMGSQTFSSAITTQFRLWPLPFLGLFLMLLWALSPVGSQASLRMLSTDTAPITSPSNISYINTRQPIYSGNGYGSWFPGFATLFSASLLASPEVKTSTMDLWDNVKIPYFSTLSNIPMNTDGWRSIPSLNFNPVYSSLFGIPISGIPSGNTTFTIESTYIELSCSSKTTNVTRGDDRTSSFQNPGLISTTGPFKSANNVTGLTTWAIGYLGRDVTPLIPESSPTRLPCLDCLPTDTEEETIYSGILLYQDFTGTRNVTSIYCGLSQVYVESQIQCNKTASTQSCAATAQRESKLSHAPNEITLFSFAEVLVGVSNLLPNATHPSSFLDVMQNYIIDPLSNSFIQSSPFPYLDTSPEAGAKESRFQDLPLKDFGDRFGQILNAFLYGSMFNSTQFLTRTSLEVMNSWEDKPNFTPATSSSDFYNEIRRGSPALTVTGNATNVEDVFKCSYPWVSVFIICTSILPIAAIAAAILNRRLIARDYLGFVSSLARESRWIDAPNGDDSWDGMKRARAMRNVQVRLGDVGDTEAGYEIGTGVALTVGKMAFGGIETTRRLDRRKLYI